MSLEPSLKFKYLSVESLIPYARNAKKHGDAHVAQLAASIREFGFVSPVIVSQDNTIVAGHGRVLAARKLGMEKVPCILESHLTPTQRRAYVLADNKLVGDDWDTEMLQLELTELKDLDFNLELTGFDEQEMDALLGSAFEPDLPPDDEPENKAKAFTIVLTFDSFVEQETAFLELKDRYSRVKVG